MKPFFFLLLIGLLGIAASPLAINNMSRGQPHRYFEEIPMREQVLDEFESTNGWTILTGVGTMAVDTNVFASGSASMRMTTTTANTQFKIYKVVTLGSMTDLQGVCLYLRYSDQGAVVGRCQVALSSGTTLSTNLNFFGDYINHPTNTWVRQCMSFGQSVKTGAEDLRGIIFIQLRFDLAVSGTNAAFYIDRLSVMRGGKAKSTLTLQFDNGSAGVWTNALPIMRSNNITGTMPVGYGVGSSSMETNKQRDMYLAGWDVISKSTNSNDTALGGRAYDWIFNSLTAQDLFLRHTNKTYRDNSGKFIIWPGGLSTVVSDQALVDFGGLYGRRTTVSNVWHRWAPNTFHNANRANFNNLPPEVIGWINQVTNDYRGQTANIYFHEILPVAASSDYYLTNFITVIDYIVANKAALKLVTIPEWHRDRLRWLTPYDRP